MKPIFDWTINLGHILTFCGFMAAGFLAFGSLDKRLTVVEQAQLYQDRAAIEAKAEVRDALKDVHVSLEKLSDRVGKGK